jgi:hypothetical protein
MTDNSLDDVFGVEQEAQSNTQLTIPMSKSEEQLEEDLAQARENILNLAATGSIALEEMLGIATASQHPRAFEVLSGLIKTLVDTNKQLLDVYLVEKDIKAPVKGVAEGQKGSGTKINKAVFVGTAAELNKLLEED